MANSGLKYSLYKQLSLHACMYRMWVNIDKKCMIKYPSWHIGHLRSDLQPHMHIRPKSLKTRFNMTQDYLEKHDVEAKESILVIWMHVVPSHLDPLLTFLLLFNVVGSEHSSQTQFAVAS